MVSIAVKPGKEISMAVVLQNAVALAGKAPIVDAVITNDERMAVLGKLVLITNTIGRIR